MLEKEWVEENSFVVPYLSTTYFSKPQEWEKWIRRFERFRIASNLNASSEENQINTLIYCMGDEADDVMRGLSVPADRRGTYQGVRDGFQAFFIVKKIVIYERAKFNLRKQEENETVDAFVTALYALAEHCGYGALHDELIRDRLVVGLSDKRLSERMQLDPDLTLEKAINMARQSEEVKRQQSSLQNDTRTQHGDAKCVDRVHKSSQKVKTKSHPDFKQSKPWRTQHNKPNPQCHKCGSSSPHPKRECPANETTCHACGKKGHYIRVCKNRKTLHEVEEDVDALFLGSVTSNGEPWMVDLHINNKSVSFKIDTGADVTVLPLQVFRKIFKNSIPPTLQKSTKPLLGPGRKPLNVLGYTELNLQKGEKEAKEVVYILKHLHTALLGRPAIHKLELVARLDNLTIETLKTSYPKLCSGLGEVKQPYNIKLKPDAQPFSLKTPRRVPLPLMDKVKKELSRMEDLGVISRIEEPTDWCSGMVVVPKKKTDKVRICVDLTHLNRSVCREKYILPSVEETLGRLAGAKIFSKLDANMGFWQIPLTEESAKYTTFITPFGRYYFKRLPFGIASAPEHFQNRMSEVIDSLEGVVCHMDDVLVWGRTQEEHDSRLHGVLKRLQEAGISLNVEKCDLSKQEVTFLGHVITTNGISPDPSKTEAVRKMKEPTNVSELRSFLGTVNQLGKFIPQLAERDKPLRDLLSKKNHWVWDVDQAQAFKDLKDSLSSPPVLVMYDPNRDSKVSADASSYGLGSVLLQKWENDWRPVAYISRALTQTEQRYAQIEKEALALTWACERFRNFLIGKHFQMETDHKPLLSLLGSQQLDALPPRIQRFKMRLMRYSYSISHVPGKSLWTADMLSRAPITHKETPEDKELLEDTNIYVDSIMENLPASTSYLEHLRQELKLDSVCARVMQLCEQGWPSHYNGEPAIRPYWVERASLSVHDGLLLKGDRLVIPSSMRNDVLTTLHEGHQGVVKCRERARQSVWWPGLSQQINELVLYCRICIKERCNPAEPLLPTQY
uniref:Gypsy retrotransposon integrase-like protein 1 n=1 Tax=Oryzias melastigma TaxID=30732 RepID=A0A3B3CEF0_ORYME